MTDRAKGFTVTLEHDMRVDDLETLLQSVRMLRGVAHVEPTITTSEDHMNRVMVKHELRNKLYNVLE